MLNPTTIPALEERIEELERAIVETVAEIDQSDGSRISLQETLDSVRETFANVYGDTLSDEVNEFLGIETVDSDLEDDTDV